MPGISKETYEFDLKIPSEIINKWNLKDGDFPLKDMLYNAKSFNLKIDNSLGKIKIIIKPLESFILQLQ